MKSKLTICGFIVLALVAAAPAQVVASHPPTKALGAPTMDFDKPVARVNSTVLTERDLLREMYAIFPYARQHDGFPKAQEAQIRKGALDMILFEELLYQEALKRNVPITAQSVSSGLRSYKEQFSSPDQYKAYLANEYNGSEKILRQRVRRALLIEWMLRTEIQQKSLVTNAEVRSYYVKNAKRFSRSETFAIQTISIFPRQDGKELRISVKKRAEDALRGATATKTYEDFGLLAEKLSDDDYRVNMGDHKIVDSSKVPPPLLGVIRNTREGQITNLVAIDNGFTIVRVNAHQAAGQQPFAEVKISLKENLAKQKQQELRAALNKKLRSTAKVELL